MFSLNPMCNMFAQGFFYSKVHQTLVNLPVRLIVCAWITHKWLSRVGNNALKQVLPKATVLEQPRCNLCVFKGDSCNKRQQHQLTNKTLTAATEENEKSRPQQSWCSSHWFVSFLSLPQIYPCGRSGDSHILARGSSVYRINFRVFCFHRSDLVPPLWCFLCCCLIASELCLDPVEYLRSSSMERAWTGLGTELLIWSTSSGVFPFPLDPLPCTMWMNLEC